MLGSFALEPTDAGNRRQFLLSPSCSLFSGPDPVRRVHERYERILGMFRSRWALYSEKQQISRCYFAVPISEYEGILRLSAISSLFFRCKQQQAQRRRLEPPLLVVAVN
jgi:hypothetical protein